MSLPLPANTLWCDLCWRSHAIDDLPCDRQEAVSDVELDDELCRLTGRIFPDPQDEAYGPFPEGGAGS